MKKRRRAEHASEQPCAAALRGQLRVVVLRQPDELPHVPRDRRPGAGVGPQRAVVPVSKQTIFPDVELLPFSVLTAL